MIAIAASEFKAKSLDLLDRVGRREMGTLSITKHGRVVAMLVPPPTLAEDLAGLHGFMRGSVVGVEAIDLTEPVRDEDCAAAGGHLHY